MRKTLVVSTIVLIMTVGGIAIAATKFSDVDQTHPQYRDIEFAVEQGWFQGYGDGTFRPDRAITDKQIAIVIKRAFPDGASRADLATFLRGGAQRLAALPSPANGCSAATLQNPTNPGCSGISGDWTITVNGASASTWWSDQYRNEGYIPITISVTARYDGESDVGNTFPDTTYELFIDGQSYDFEIGVCSDNEFGVQTPKLLAGYDTTFKICFEVPEDSSGSGALLRSRSWPADWSWHTIVIP